MTLCFSETPATANQNGFDMLKFNPWKGKDYLNANPIGKRILILGESHYGDNGTEKDNTTVNLLERIRTRAIKLPFFTKIQMVVDPNLKNEYPTALDCETFWSCVAFSNVVQEFVDEMPRKRPTKEHWAKAPSWADEIIRQTAPQVVIVAGAQVQRALETSSHKNLFVKLNHPASFGFKTKFWREEVQKVLISQQ
jgi:hypothetical protein